MQLQLPPEKSHCADKGRLVLEYGSLAGRGYHVQTRICPNPCCRCGDLEMRCTPEAPAGNSVSPDPLCLTLDINQQKLAISSQPQMDLARELARAVLQEIALMHWSLLAEHFIAVKEILTAQADLNQLKPEFPPDVLAGNGPMVAYHDILPYATRLSVVADERTWIVDEQYCLHLDCTCQESAITFIRMDQAGVGRRRKPVTVTVRYNYATGAMRRESPSSPRNSLPEALFAALRETYPDLNSLLAQHQRTLSQLLRNVTGQTAVKPAPPPESPTPDSALASRPELAPKPGRNEPCPCGSGKKFKKCCGRN